MTTLLNHAMSPSWVVILQQICRPCSTGRAKVLLPPKATLAQIIQDGIAETMERVLTKLPLGHTTSLGVGLSLPKFLFFIAHCSGLQYLLALELAPFPFSRLSLLIFHLL